MAKVDTQKVKMINSKLQKLISEIQPNEVQKIDVKSFSRNPSENYFDREKVCAQLTYYSQFGKFKKKYPSMLDKTRMALSIYQK